MAITKPPVLPAWAETGDKVQPASAEIQAGWPSTTTPPSRQRFNWILNFCANAVRYFSRRGLPDYDTDETYMTGDRVIGDDGKTYSSLVDNNKGAKPSANAAKWVRWGYTQAELSDALPAASTALPKMAGTAAVGTGTAWARADHVHPTDTTRAPLASPAFTGTPTVPTAAAGTNTTQAASTAFVTGAVNGAFNGIKTGIPYVVATGSANAYVLTYSPEVTALTDGLVLAFQVNASNTGASTLAVNGLGAKSVVGQDTQALIGGELIAGYQCLVVFNSAKNYFELIANTGGYKSIKTTLATPTADSAAPAAVSTATAITGLLQTIWNKILYLFDMRGNFKGYVSSTDGMQLTASQAGTVVGVGANHTVFLPPISSVSAGQMFTFVNRSASAFCAVKINSQDNDASICPSSTQTSSEITLCPGDTISLAAVPNGSPKSWRYTGGSFAVSGNIRASIRVSESTTLTNNQSGALFAVAVAGITMTLPPAYTLPQGSTFGFYNISSGDTVTIAVNAADSAPNTDRFIYVGATSSKTISVGGGETIFLCFTNGIWKAISGPAASPGRLVGVKVFKATGTYTPAPALTAIEVEITGGGAAGGGVPATGTNECAASGGGGGSTSCKVRISPAPTDTQAIVIGSGGKGTAGGAGTSGGTSSFGDYISCIGGSSAPAGQKATQYPPSSALAGPPGFGNCVEPTISGTGVTVISRAAGGMGGWGFVFPSMSAIGGDGGASLLGPGATGTSYGAGFAAISPGSGGGGTATAPNSAALKGGDGYNGICIVYEYR